jgi:hypothetical protein
MSVTVDHPNITKLCHDFYVVGQAIWQTAQLSGLTNTQITTICTNAKNNRLANYTTNSVHVAILSALAAL